MYSITIEKKFPYQSSIGFGLNITGKCPVFVGCSLKTLDGEIIDRPGKYLKSEGVALFGIHLKDDESKFNKGFGKSCEGYVMFALWKDDSFTERLADTGWIKWSTPFLMMGSTAGLDMMDDEIERTYKDRKDVWIESQKG